MIRINAEHCTGCRTCEQLCPQKCISMEPDKNGFLYPEIDRSRCVGCGLCEQRCPANVQTAPSRKPDVYAAWLKDEKVLNESSSGGAFTALAEYVLSRGGAVFGCAFDEQMTAIHICARTTEELNRLRGSKYVQSDTGDTFAQAKLLLERNVPVLYSGTPCQIAGLKAFLRKDYSNLLTVDLVCHGVPSPMFFKKYLEWLKRKKQGNILKFSFRDKSKFGWGICGKALLGRGGQKISEWLTPQLDPYLTVFLSGDNYRGCCYSCPYASPKREGDFTIGDFWGIEKPHPEIPRKGGVSVLMLNSEKALSVFPELKKSLFVAEATFEQASVENRQLLAPTERSKKRGAFLAAAQEEDFQAVVLLWKKYYWKNILTADLKRRVPPGFKRAVKKCLKAAGRAK